MQDLEVKTPVRTYPIHIENSFAHLPDALAQAGLSGRKIFIITDSNVCGLYLAEVKALLQPTAAVHDYIFEAGENSKTLDTVKNIYGAMLHRQLDRGSVVLALGGGVTGDMAGFAAASYMRGLPYVQLPTTLLSQVDSSVGGKVGVDFMENKNLIGAFYQPHFVYSNTATLRTLPEDQFASGMGEVIKHAVIASHAYFTFLRQNSAAIQAKMPEALRKTILASNEIKANVVNQDEKETGLREILNFGHTFGHAVESLSHFTLPHGHCVAIGMMAALRLSQSRGLITENDRAEVAGLLRIFQLPEKAAGLNAEGIYTQMFLDKKTKNGAINLVLVSEIGKAFRDNSATPAEIREAIASIL